MKLYIAWGVKSSLLLILLMLCFEFAKVWYFGVAIVGCVLVCDIVMQELSRHFPENGFCQNYQVVSFLFFLCMLVSIPIFSLVQQIL